MFNLADIYRIEGRRIEISKNCNKGEGIFHNVLLTKTLSKKIKDVKHAKPFRAIGDKFPPYNFTEELDVPAEHRLFFHLETVQLF